MGVGTPAQDPVNFLNLRLRLTNLTIDYFKVIYNINRLIGPN